MNAFRFDTSGFVKGTQEIQRMVQRNTQTYGRVLASKFESEAKGNAPWVDRKGNARMHLYGKSTTNGTRVQVEMGGSAPNYKGGALAAKDYLEYLEFDHGKKYAAVFPNAQAIQAGIADTFGDAALHGKMRVNFVRNRKDLNMRRRQILMQTMVLHGRWEGAAYNEWLRSRRMFNG